jgi:hypothetical protein
VESLKSQYFWLLENSKGPSERMPLANAILAMCRARKTRLGDDFQSVIYRRREFEGLRLEVPDFAFDQHTQAGRAKGRGWDHWETEGLQLSNETVGLNTYRDEASRLRRKYGKMPKKAQKGNLPKADKKSPGQLFD